MALHLHSRRERTVVGIGVAALHVGLGYLLLLGLGVDLPRRTEEGLAVFDLTDPPPPPPAPPPRPANPKPSERAAPPDLRAVPKLLVAPPPLIQTSQVSLAAPIASDGADARAGAAPVTGSGTGAGGIGDGLGGGGAGEGAGGLGAAVRAQRVAGEIRNADYPRSAARAREQGDVVAHIFVDAAGRVAACAIARSSGSAELDATTCRLIRARFRYRPALDHQGRPVADELGWRQSWWLAR